MLLFFHSGQPIGKILRLKIVVRCFSANRGFVIRQYEKRIFNTDRDGHDRSDLIFDARSVAKLFRVNSIAVDEPILSNRLSPLLQTSAINYL